MNLRFLIHNNKYVPCGCLQEFNLVVLYSITIIIVLYYKKFSLLNLKLIIINFVHCIVLHKYNNNVLLLLILSR